MYNNNKTRTLTRTGHWIERNLSEEIPVFQMARQKYTRGFVYFLVQAIFFSPLLCSRDGWWGEVSGEFVRTSVLPTWFPLLLAGWLPVPEEHGYYIIQMSMYTYNSWPGEENQPLLSDPLWVSFVNLDGGLVCVDVLQYQHHYRRWYTRFPFTWMDGLAGLCDAIYPSIHPSTSRVQ